jgi:hypothetical protein
MIRRSLSAGALLLAFGTACAAPLPTIALEPAQGAWRVSYAFEQPVEAMRFARIDRHGNRVADWRALDPAVELVLDGDEELARRRDGQPFDRMAFELAARYRPLEKDYAPFSPFGDGGLLIHTGRFHACADRCTDAATHAGWTFAVTPPAAARVLHSGEIHEGRLHFTDTGSGTNLYVGAATPVETADVLAIVDPTFPPAARQTLDELFPRLMALYAGQLGALPAKPMLFASHDARHPGGGYGYQGGTLPGQVFVHIYGRHPNFDSAEFADRMRWHFAHEAAHMFQHYDQHPADPGASWIHEGGAEAKAALALQRLGMLDQAGLDDRIDDAITRCSSGLAERTLDTSHLGGAFDNFYQCGLLLQLAVDAAARRATDGRCDLFCIWRDFRNEVERGAGWTGPTFIGVVERHAGAETADFVRRIVGERLDAPEQVLREGLRMAGVPREPRVGAGGG